MTTTMSSRDFNQDTARAKKAARRGPVIITDRGKPAHVLLTIDAYQRLSGEQRTLLDIVAQLQPAADFEFTAPRLDLTLKTADLT